MTVFVKLRGRKAAPWYAFCGLRNPDFSGCSVRKRLRNAPPFAITPVTFYRLGAAESCVYTAKRLFEAISFVSKAVFA